MLAELHIQNYAVIDHLSIEFRFGLNLLSGETGSGKSILVDALGLALGGRASPELIRTGQERATVTAVFRASGRAPWARWVDEYGVAASEDAALILRREIHSSGKSRLLVNDQPVTLAAIQGLASRLVELHGQGEHAALLAREAQLDLLDQFAGVQDLREKVGELHRQRRETERQLEAIEQNERDRLRTIDLLTFQVRELEDAKLEPGEDARLEQERRVLANLEKIRALAAGAFANLYEEEGAAVARVAAALGALEELARYDASVAPALETLRMTRAGLEDVSLHLRDYLQQREASPWRLEEVEDRLALIDRLKRKYGRTVDEALVYLKRARAQLAAIEHADERREALARELKVIAEEYRKAATELSERRKEVARKMEKQVRAELAQLGMEKTRFEISFARLPAGSPVSSAGAVPIGVGPRPTPIGDPEAIAPGGPTGIDRIEFRVSPNPGEELRALEKIASGGEVSRLMLALKAVVAQARGGNIAGSSGSVGAGLRPAPTRSDKDDTGAAPTFIFDEVDAGIGGRVAESVGQRLKRLARDVQVLCVTHLAQIACFADHHFYVEKLERAGRTIAQVKYLDTGRERAQELARMLSGSQVTDAVLKHATVMLKQAGAS